MVEKLIFSSSVQSYAMGNVSRGRGSLFLLFNKVIFECCLFEKSCSSGRIFPFKNYNYGNLFLSDFISSFNKISELKNENNALDVQDEMLEFDIIIPHNTTFTINYIHVILPRQLWYQYPQLLQTR